MELFYTDKREEWREYLSNRFEAADEIWFVFPMKESGENSLSYNDAVEEALCKAFSKVLDIGETGIFIVNGSGFIKQYGGDRLISINSKYDDIIFSEGDYIKCAGKVIGTA